MSASGDLSPITIKMSAIIWRTDGPFYVTTPSEIVPVPSPIRSAAVAFVRPLFVALWQPICAVCPTDFAQNDGAGANRLPTHRVSRRFSFLVEGGGG